MEEATSYKLQAASFDFRRWCFILGKRSRKNFKQLKIWQKGFAIAAQAFKLIDTFPREERFGLAMQITRAAISIASNIAEGSSRSSVKDYNRFLELALGSSYELETQLLIAAAVNYGNEQLRGRLLQDIEEEQRMLIAFIHTINKAPVTGP